MGDGEIGDGRVVAGWSDLYRNFFVHWRGVVTEEDGMLKEGHVRERIEQMFQRGFTRKGERREGGNEDTRVMWLPTCCLELK